MSVTCKPSMAIGTIETLSVDGVGSSVQVPWREFDNPSINLSSTSTPPVSAVGGDSLAMTAGAATIDLTAVPGVSGTVSFSGLKVVEALFRNDSAAAITVATGASNGYVIGTHVIHPGGSRLIHFADGLSDVDGTHKTIDVTGTGTHVLKYILVAG